MHGEVIKLAGMLVVSAALIALIEWHLRGWRDGLDDVPDRLAGGEGPDGDRAHGNDIHSTSPRTGQRGNTP